MKNGTHVYLTYIFCITICVLPSCNKESGPTNVNGTVRDVTTNVGVSNAEVGLFETDGESAFGLGGVLMEEKYSDASGEFIFSFDAREGYQYFVQAIKDQYFNDQSNNVMFIDGAGTSSNLYVFLQPEGYLEIHYQNIPPSTPYDNFGVNGYLTDGFDGDEIDTTVLYTVYGNSQNIIYWGLYGEVANIDTIYCVAFDTTYYELLY